MPWGLISFCKVGVLIFSKNSNKKAVLNNIALSTAFLVRLIDFYNRVLSSVFKKLKQ